MNRRASSGVRITGGAWRGRGVAVPPGARPTEGRVREALFSIWQDRLPGSRFLDLFAGSGVVGMEAASRGAGSVLWIDQDGIAVRTIAANYLKIAQSARSNAAEGPISTFAHGANFESRRLSLPSGLTTLTAARPATGSTAAGAAGAAPRFDLVFADPPYDFDQFAALLLALPPLLAAGVPGVPGAAGTMGHEIAIEHSARRALPPAAGPLAQCDLRRYGESAVAFYRLAE